MSRIVVTGATGTIGSAVVQALKERGDTVVALSRSAAGAREKLGDRVEVHEWAHPTEEPPPAAALAAADAVIHLLGEPVDQRWTAEAREAIRDSRELGTRHLVAGLAALPQTERPKVLVSQSATGFYGPHGDEIVDEATPAGGDFLAGVVTAWEHEASQAPDGVRVAMLRTGVVLSPTGGALAKMLPFFKAGVGGPVAGGRQYVPWVHLDDVVGALLFAADTPAAAGPLNLTAPNPVTNRELSKTLGKVLGRPAALPVPAFGVKALYGRMAEIVTTGARVVPTGLERLGYTFRYPRVEGALAAALGKP